MTRDPRHDAPGSFWARRRAAVEAEDRAEVEAKRAEEAAAEEVRLAERPDEEILAELGLPDPDVMERTDQVQALLREAVPQRLKTRALRRLWRLNPVLANIDGLVDYGGDYTDAATVVENLQTAYQVGRGMLKTLVQDEDEPAADTPEDATAEVADDYETADVDAPVAGPEEETPAYRHVYDDEEDGDEAPARTARRMRFTFDT
ncbi:DUF3306 domain-containing protein [Citreimonas salinaria]|uniref:DUF3306 domain-containing protein n=1 Tax=Citreimonas salinaria TaxID=321339 RepID=A0A1H3F280_9RHOB|nr:DUF3306 domain-containing protein [Citreimonas salinaria]SDX84428.1 Protein of unknown function [Citreimonas salinaria]